VRIPEGDLDQGDVERVCFIFDLQQKHGRISIYLSIYPSIYQSINLYTYMNTYIIYKVAEPDLQQRCDLDQGHIESVCFIFDLHIQHGSIINISLSLSLYIYRERVDRENTGG